MKEENAGISENSNLTLEKLTGILRRFWWLLLLFALLGGSAAYYYTARQPRIYKKVASVMMRDNTAADREDASERILHELGADTGAANLANESYILKSTALMQHVVEKLRLNTTYHRASELRLVDIYGDSPIRTNFERINTPDSFRLQVTPLNEREFSLKYTDAGKPYELTAGYGELLELPQATLRITPSAAMSTESYGEPIYITRDSVQNTTRNLLEVLSVTRPDLKDASMLEISITCGHPGKAEDILNELIEAYNRHTQEERSDAARKTKQFIMARLRELGHELGSVASRLRESQQAASGNNFAESVMESDFRLSQSLAQEIFSKETQLKLARSMEQEFEANAADGSLLSTAGQLTESLADKVSLYNEACLEYARYAASAGSRNPVAAALREKMGSALSAARQSLSNYCAALQLELTELQNKQRELETRMSTAADRQLQLQPLLREQKVKEALYMLLLTKEQENALALAIASPTARVLETAHGSDAPIAPRTGAIVTAGTAGGAALCGLGLLGLSLLNTRIRNRHDAESAGPLPVVAELPELNRKERKRRSFVLQAPHSSMAECLHILRNNVDNFLPRPEQGGGHIVLLTSTVPNEGKTFISANLAATYARSGKHVLVIDADLRKQSLTRAMEGNGRRGLSNLLLREIRDPRDVLHPLPGTLGLPGSADIMYSGSAVPDPVTLLSQPLLGKLLQHLRPQYDAVLLDAPPYGVLADTDLLAAQADLTLYVVRSGKIQRNHLQRIHRLQESGKLPHVALVLNAVNFRAESYSYYGYEYGYGVPHRNGH